MKLRHFPPSQLKPRHQTYCSLFRQGDPKTRRYYLGPHAHLKLAQAPRRKRIACGKVGMGHNTDEGLERAPPTHALQGKQTSRMETWATLWEVGGEAQDSLEEQGGKAERPTRHTLLNV